MIFVFKVVLLKYVNLVFYILGMVEFVLVVEEEVSLVCVLFYYIVGIVVLFSFIYFMWKILMLFVFDLDIWFMLVSEECVSNVFVVFMMLLCIIVCMEEGVELDLLKLKVIVYGGGFMFMVVIEKVM